MEVAGLDTPLSALDLALFLLVVICSLVVCVYHGWASRHYNRGAADSTAATPAGVAAALPLRITRKTVLSDLAFLFSIFSGFAFVSGTS